MAKSKIRLAIPTASWAKSTTFVEEGRKTILSDRLSFVVFIICCASFLLQMALIFYSFSKLPPVVPLFYSKPWGEGILAPKMGLFLLPLTVFLFTFLNFFIVRIWVRGNFFLYRILVVFSLLAAFAASYDTVKIISLLI